MRKNMLKQLVVLAGAVAISGCLGSAPQSGSGSGSGSAGSGSSGDTGGSSSGGSSSGGSSSGGSSSAGAADGGAAGSTTDPGLAARQIDYGQALRTAAVKLVGALPTLDEQAAVTDATSYAAQIDKYMADARFPTQLKAYFGDMMKMGGSLPVVNAANKTVNVSLDTAPTFATELVVKDLPLTGLWTATTNTCPTLNTATGVFTDASCPAATGESVAGVLSDPGAMAQFYSNMAFRRVRWVQESFVCNAFPTEFSAKPVAMGSGQFTSPWPFTSITGGATAQINFQDTSSIICANCHTTMNHMAPLFAQFDVTGVYTNAITVRTPTPTAPLSVLGDWLPATEGLAWRYGTKVTTLADLGNAMAADPQVLKCQVQRAWNWAMSKTDIVNSLAVVPDSTIADQWALFQSSGYKLKGVLKSIFTADDFVKF
jgi:hypothetical protein